MSHFFLTVPSVGTEAYQSQGTDPACTGGAEASPRPSDCVHPPCSPLRCTGLFSLQKKQKFVVTIPKMATRWECCSKRSVFLCSCACLFSKSLCPSFLSFLPFYFSSSPSFSLVYYGTEIFIFLGVFDLLLLI